MPEGKFLIAFLECSFWGNLMSSYSKLLLKFTEWLKEVDFIWKSACLCVIHFYNGSICSINLNQQQAQQLRLK